MNAATSEGLRFAAGLALAAAAYPLRHLGRRADPVRHWWLTPLVDVATAGAVAGILLGATAPRRVAESLDQLVALALVFLAGWLGLTAGCSMDLRVLRRHRGTHMAVEALQSAATLALVSLAAWAGSRLFEVETGLVTAAGLFLVAGLCTAGPPLPRPRTPRKAAGTRPGFWRPSASAVLGIALVGIGVSFVRAEPFALRLPWAAEVTPLLLEGATTRLWWALVLGGLAGLLCDLGTREEFALGGLYYLLAGTVLLAGGLAAALGMEPLLVGCVAGIWLINATLRRVDVVHVLGRGAAVPRLGVPVLAGWMLARTFPGAGAGDWLAFGVVLLALLGVRTAVRVRGARVGGGGTPQAARAAEAGGLAGLLVVGELPLVIAAGASRVVAAPTAWAVLAAAVASQLILGAAAALVRHRSAPPLP
ncbi:MAG: hypothetical protein ABIL09_20890 [Gemmatimonadota bacterium]